MLESFAERIKAALLRYCERQIADHKRLAELEVKHGKSGHPQDRDGALLVAATPIIAHELTVVIKTEMNALLASTQKE